MTYTAAGAPVRAVEQVAGQLGADGRLRLRGTDLHVEGGGGERVEAGMGVHTYTLRRDGDGALAGQIRNSDGAVYTVRLFRE